MPLLSDVLAELERDMGRDAGDEFVALAAEYFADTRDGTTRVSSGVTPESLAARFDEPLPRAGRSLAEVAARLRSDILPYSNRLCHPMALGHQVSAPLPATVWTESVTAALNQSLAVFEMSPAGTVLERRVVTWMTELLGWDAASGGTLTSGGTEATFAALLAARAAAVPDAWRDGVGADPPAIVCGEHAHYAVTRAAGEMGLGMRRVSVIPSHEYRMDPSALASRLNDLAASGTRVLAVVATAGSTATGSFDDLNTIGALCEARGLWLHVDGAHGAAALLSPTRGTAVAGLRRARSIAIDPHKMMLLPLSAGMVLVREERDLETAFAQQAPYLFHGGAGVGREWDQGVRSFQCSRRADVLKLWVALQRYGADGIGLLYDHLCDTTRALFDRVESRPDFEALHAPECNILCFRYLPDHAGDTGRVDAVNRALRPAYNAAGDGWITATVLGGRPVLRVTVMNPRTTARHMDRLLDGLVAEGRRLAVAR